MQNIEAKIENVGGEDELVLRIKLAKFVGQTAKGNPVIAQTDGMFENVPNVPGVIMSCRVMRWEKRRKA
jgi:hypothetical protein